MFIDYLTLMLVNMTAGLVILALYLYKGIEEIDQSRWAPAFGISGFIALMTGFNMIFHWHLPGSYNIAYGEMSVLLGALFAGTAYCTYKDIDLKIVAIYGFFAGLAAIVAGLAIIYFKMTKAPLISGLGFILTGMGGVCSFPTLLFQRKRMLRYVGAVVMLLAALIWAMTAYPALWGHLESFSKYVPPTMK